MAKRGGKRVHVEPQERKQNVTVITLGSRSRVAIPPTTMLTLALMTPKNSMNLNPFKLSLQHLAKYKLEGKCLFIFDMFDAGANSQVK